MSKQTTNLAKELMTSYVFWLITKFKQVHTLRKINAHSSQCIEKMFCYTWGHIYNSAKMLSIVQYWSYLCLNKGTWCMSMNCQITEPLKMWLQKTCNSLSVEMHSIQLDHFSLKDTFLMGNYRMQCYLVVHFKRR